MTKKVLIKDISKELNLNPKTIRFYEEIGIIPKAKRNESNYRVYTAKDVERIAFVKKARLLGFSIEDIKKIIEIRETGNYPCCTVINILEKQEKELEKRIEEMIEFKTKLTDITKTFKENIKVGEKGQICGLIEILFKD